MEAMAARLLMGDDEESLVQVKTGTIMCFEQTHGGGWVMSWMIVPELTR